MFNQRVIIVDIDGTVADCTHRLHYIEGTNRNYKAFYDELNFDSPIWHIIRLVRQLAKNPEYLIYFVTGRPDTHREETLEWLSMVGIIPDELHMRSGGDYRKDFIVKQEILNRIREKGKLVEFAIDDRQSVVDMWRKNDVPCLQVAPGDFDEVKYANQPGKLILLVGPSGAGKSTYAKEYTYPIKTQTGSEVRVHWTPDEVISSDSIRGQLCGDFRDQSKNNQVFVAMHRIIKARVESGLLAVVDATNLRNADRKTLLNLVPKNTLVEYHIINRSVEEKKKTGGWRLTVENNGETLIDRHERIFQSNLKEILKGDGDLRVTVIDSRKQ